MHMKRKPILLLVLLLALLLTAVSPAAYAQESTPTQADETTSQQGQGTILDAIEADPSLSTFELLVKAAGLADNLDGGGLHTVFAPTNEAWDAFEANGGGNGLTLTQVLLYHVANGRYPAANLGNMSSLTTLGGQSLGLNLDANGLHYNGMGRGIGDQVVASNGVLHVIDTVMVPQVNALTTSPAGSSQQNIIQVLTENGNFGTFLSLVEQAGLTSRLQNANGNFTVFAPTDEAFAAVQSDMMNQWTADPTGALHTILTYHIVTDRLAINQIANDDFLPTLEGRPLIVTTDENKSVFINGSPVTTFNMRASNGVIHIVDRVLVPTGM
jgi:transforming growth factor-beta-induced protein